MKGGMFGGARRGGFGEMYPAAPAPQQAPRRGLFGRVGNWLQTRDWERMGAALRDDPSYLANLEGGRREERLMAQRVLEQKEMQRRYETSQAAQSQEARAEQEQRAQMEAIISQLPPDQQAFARLNPEGYVSGIMRHRFPAPRGADGGQTDPDGWVYEP